MSLLCGGHCRLTDVSNNRSDFEFMVKQPEINKLNNPEYGHARFP
jgi:hypothetical protein